MHNEKFQSENNVSSITETTALRTPSDLSNDTNNATKFMVQSSIGNTDKDDQNNEREDKKPKHKKKRKNKSYLGPDFIAPDGGWGWFVCLAAGCSNLCAFPVLQQFGLIFRDRLSTIGLSSSQITTIINLNSCLTSCVGLLNGPMFRRFSYRQIGLFGAALVAIALFFTSISNSFLTYVLTFSILYGAGTGINASANALALNTYFKDKRRMATGLSWTSTALGPIIMPHIIAYILPMYGVQGTVMLYSGFALNAIACALIFQPVQWHVKKPPSTEANYNNINQPNNYYVHDNTDSINNIDKEKYYRSQSVELIECDHCRMAKHKNHSLFSSQYLYNADNSSITGYEIIDPGIPMLAHCNDGWYSGSSQRSIYESRLSLTSSKTLKFDSRKSSNPNLVLSNRPSYVNLGLLAQSDREKRKELSNKIKIDEVPIEDCPSFKAPHDLKEYEKNVLPTTNNVIDRQISQNETKYLVDNHSILSLKSSLTPFRKRSNTFNIEKEVLKGASKKLEQYIYNDTKSNINKNINITNDIQNNININSYYNSHNINNFNKKSMTRCNTRTTFCTCDEERLLYKERNYELNNLDKIDSNIIQNGNGHITLPKIDESSLNRNDKSRIKLNFWQKFVIFFDLDLLKDFTYVNLMVGVTIANFSELNFSILTPFVFAEFGLSKSQIAMAMSLLGGMDIAVRFFIPFLAGKIGWENKTFFLFGVLGMAMGRIVIAHYHSYEVIIAACCWIGLNKGLRTVFMALVIPSHVPLDRLPAASGLQLLFAGIFYFVMGPIIGWIRDATDYTVTLHCLNITTYLTAFGWGFEKLYRQYQEKRELRRNAYDYEKASEIQ